MENIKERIIGAVTVMSLDEANKIWDIILKEYSNSWEDIEEIEPDEWDIKTLEDIENNPECREFV